MKIGILGGAFDPVHNDHVKMVKGAYETMGMDKVVLLPSYRSPHKKHPLTDFSVRIEMLKKACPFPYVIIDGLEKEVDLENNYTYLMIPKLKEKYPKDDLYLIIGGDSLVNFTKWKHPEIVLKEIPLRVVKRKGVNGEEAAMEFVRKEYGGDVELYDFSCEGYSSREIRAHIALGMGAKVLPNGVGEIISELGLYAEYGDIVEKLKRELPENLFLHCVRTALYAVKLSAMAGVEYHEAFLGGLLHDAAKCRVPTKAYPSTAPQVVHQYEGAEVARDEYGIINADILDAIRYHTTGKGEMTALGKVIFAADKLELGRHYPEAERLRERINEDFDEGFFELLRHNRDFLIEKGCVIDSLSEACYSKYIH